MVYGFFFVELRLKVFLRLNFDYVASIILKNCRNLLSVEFVDEAINAPPIPTYCNFMNRLLTSSSSTLKEICIPEFSFPNISFPKLHLINLFYCDYPSESDFDAQLQQCVQNMENFVLRIDVIHGPPAYIAENYPQYCLLGQFRATKWVPLKMTTITNSGMIFEIFEDVKYPKEIQFLKLGCGNKNIMGRFWIQYQKVLSDYTNLKGVLLHDDSRVGDDVVPFYYTKKFNLRSK